MKVIVSACLLGRRCKYDGGHNKNSAVLRFLEGKEVLPVCPESLVMPPPRPPAEIREGRVITKAGEDRTALFTEGVRRTLALIEGEKPDLAVLKARSPTCGAKEIYDGTFTGTRIPGSGLLAAALLARGIPVIDEEELEKK